MRFGFPQDQQQHLIWIISARCRCPAEHRLIDWLVGWLPHACCVLGSQMVQQDSTTRYTGEAAKPSLCLTVNQQVGWLHRLSSLIKALAFTRILHAPHHGEYNIRCNQQLYLTLPPQMQLSHNFTLPYSTSSVAFHICHHLNTITLLYSPTPTNLSRNTSQLGANREKPHTTIRPNPTSYI